MEAPFSEPPAPRFEVIDVPDEWSVRVSLEQVDGEEIGSTRNTLRLLCPTRARAVARLHSAEPVNGSALRGLGTFVPTFANL